MPDPKRIYEAAVQYVKAMETCNGGEPDVENIRFWGEALAYAMREVGAMYLFQPIVGYLIGRDPRRLDPDSVPIESRGYPVSHDGEWHAAVEAARTILDSCRGGAAAAYFESGRGDEAETATPEPRDPARAGTPAPVTDQASNTATPTGATVEGDVERAIAKGDGLDGDDDHRSYVSASEILNLHDPKKMVVHMASLKRILKQHTEIGRRKPAKNRLDVHLGHWAVFYNHEYQTPAGDPMPAEIKRQTAFFRAAK